MKTPNTTEVTLSAVNKRQFNKAPVFTPRQRRVMAVLWNAIGWISRESIDRIARASNGPEVIRQLRHTHGVGIDMQRIEVMDADGLASNPGRYQLTRKGREALAGWGFGAAQ